MPTASDFDPSLFVGASSDLNTITEEPIGSNVQDPMESTTPTALDTEPATVTSTSDVPVVDPTSSVQTIEPADYASLTPRELALIERLERVTGEKLDVSKVMPESTPVVPSTTEEHNFLEGFESIDDALATPENFNRLLVSVYNRGLEQSSKLAAENILRNLPQVISQYVTQHLTMTEIVNQFYRDNPELSQVKRTVAAVANEISSEKPELQLQEVFSQAAERVYTMLGLKRGAQQTTTLPTHAASTGLVQPRGSTSRMKQPQLQGLAAEVGELFDIH